MLHQLYCAWTACCSASADRLHEGLVQQLRGTGTQAGLDKQAGDSEHLLQQLQDASRKAAARLVKSQRDFDALFRGWQARPRSLRLEAACHL